MTTTPMPELPKLPEPYIHKDGVWRIKYFTTSQMQAYAIAAIEAATLAERGRCLQVIESRSGTLPGTGAWVALTNAADEIRGVL